MARRTHIDRTRISILREHLVEGVAVSDLCEKHGIRPTVFYRSQKILFESGEAAFERSGRKRDADEAQRQTTALKEKIRRKDEVLAELMEEYVAPRKTWEI